MAALFEATIDATEEAILNALVAGRDCGRGEPSTGAAAAACSGAGRVVPTQSASLLTACGLIGGVLRGVFSDSLLLESSRHSPLVRRTERPAQSPRMRASSIIFEAA
jgi:hypothetical protein